MRGTRPDGVPMYLVLVAYLFLAFVFLPAFPSFYYKDEISYVAAAERYASGNFGAAPNSLWGPLVSWLMAIPLFLGAKALTSARIVSLFCGAATLLATNRLAKTLDISGRFQVMFFVALVPLIVCVTVIFAITADIALTAILVLYFSIIFNQRYPENRYAGVLCGLLGGLAFFAKGFGLPFFLIHFTLASATFYLADSDRLRRKQIVRHAMTGLVVFGVLAACWVAMLFQKYGVITAGITGQYNHAIVGPGVKERPALLIGFTAPPADTTVSIWEDPAYFYDLPAARACCLRPWSAFDSVASLRHQLGLIELNLGRTIVAFFKFSIIWPLALFGAAAFVLAPIWRREKRHAKIDAIRILVFSRERMPELLMLGTIAIYVFPYILVFSDARFFWPVVILLIALGLRLLSRLFDTARFSSSTFRWITIGVFTLSFLPFPLKKLTGNQEAPRATASFASQLETAGLTGKSFASDTDYGAAVCVGYHIGAKYYGQAAPGMSDAKIASELRRFGVQYYFVWDADPVVRPGMKLLRLLTAEHRRLAIYTVI